MGLVLMNASEGRLLSLDRDSEALRRVLRMRRRLSAWGDALEGCRGDGYVWVLVGLTYRPGVEWRPNHIRDFLRAVRRRCNVVGYAWVAELTQAGVVHYHVILVMRRGEWLPKPDDAGLWPWGSTRIEMARRGVGYLISYARKLEQKGLGRHTFPKGLRMFAVWVVGGLLDAARGFVFRLSTLPRWLAVIAAELGAFPIRREGGGWRFPDVCGAVVWSPWEVVVI